MNTTLIDRNRPTLGAAIAILLYELATWGLTLIPDTVPATVVDAAGLVAVAGVAALVGWAVQQAGEKAPWAFDTHAAAVAYALSLDPDVHGAERDELLRLLGVDGEARARQLIGLDDGGSLMGYAATFRQIVGRARPGSTIGPVAHLILHHEYGQPLPATATLAQEKARLRAIDAYHRSLGWAGFGYSTMPCASGRNLEGRGYRRSGAHTGHMNRTALAAMLPGTDTGMTDAQVDAIRAWHADGIAQGAIRPSARWTAHRDHMDRDCPGDRNYAQLHRLNDPEEDDMTDEERKLLTDTAAAVARIERRLGSRNDDRATVLDDTGRLRETVRTLADQQGLETAYEPHEGPVRA